MVNARIVRVADKNFSIFEVGVRTQGQPCWFPRGEPNKNLSGRLANVDGPLEADQFELPLDFSLGAAKVVGDFAGAIAHEAKKGDPLTRFV